MGDSSQRFPLYLMKIGQNQKFLTMQEAGMAFSSLHEEVEIGGKVLEADSRVRDITEKEREQIRDIADRVDASK